MKVGGKVGKKIDRRVVEKNYNNNLKKQRWKDRKEKWDNVGKKGDIWNKKESDQKKISKKIIERD